VAHDDISIRGTQQREQEAAQDGTCIRGTSITDTNIRGTRQREREQEVAQDGNSIRYRGSKSRRRRREDKQRQDLQRGGASWPQDRRHAAA